MELKDIFIGDVHRINRTDIQTPLHECQVINNDDKPDEYGQVLVKVLDGMNEGLEGYVLPKYLV